MNNTENTLRALHPMPGLSWTQIRDTAVAFATHGWPVLPGTYQLARHGAWLGKPGAMGLEPVAEVWTMAATTDPTIAMDWWTRRPYAVLLSCGIFVDAFEVSRSDGERAMEFLHSPRSRGPIAITPFGSWLMFVRSGARLAVSSDDRLVWHQDGSWVPLPPTSREQVPYRWHVTPAAVGWHLPDAALVRQALRGRNPTAQERLDSSEISRSAGERG